MLENSRTKNSLRNIVVSVGCQFAALFLSFVTRTVFIHILGTDYLGINGLFSSILSVMSLADLGFGTAIVYTLYKPILNNDTKRISALVNFYGKVYKIVALVTFAVGIALVPFLHYLVNLESEIPKLRLYYVLFLLDSVCSYLFVYKSAVLEADQKNYVIKVNRTVFLLITNIVKLGILYFTKNYTLFLVFQIIGTLCGNISVFYIAEKHYPYLKKSKEQLEKKEKRAVLDNVGSLFLYKIGGVILNSTDNILISVIVSTTVVGFYSNYLLLFSTVVMFSEIIFGALGASVGNLNASRPRGEVYDAFKMINFANFWVYGFCSIMLYCLLDDFISLWLGPSYVLGGSTTLIICLNVFMPGMLSAVGCFRNATGLFRQTKYVFCITAILNLIFSVWFGNMWGLNGIILATAMARLCTNVWFEPFVLVRKFFSQSFFKYCMRLLTYYGITFALIFLIYWLKKMFFVLSLSSFCIELLLCAVFVNIAFYLLYKNTDEFRFLFQHLMPFLRKLIKRKENI